MSWIGADSLEGNLEEVGFDAIGGRVLRTGNGGGGLRFVLELVVAEAVLSRLAADIGDEGPLSRSSVRAPGICPTRFGGGAKVLTSLTSIVAKYRGAISSSFFPAKAARIQDSKHSVLTFPL